MPSQGADAASSSAERPAQLPHRAKGTDLRDGSSLPCRTQVFHGTRKFRGFPNPSALPALMDNAGMRQEENDPGFTRVTAGTCRQAVSKAEFRVLLPREPCVQQQRGPSLALKHHSRPAVEARRVHGVRAWGAGTHLAPKLGNKTAQESLQNRGGGAAIAARLCWVGVKAGDGLATSWGEDRRVAALSPSGTCFPHRLFLAPNLQPDPRHSPAHGKGEGLSRGSSAGKVQGRRRRCGNARLPTRDGAVGAAEWGSPSAGVPGPARGAGTLSAACPCTPATGPHFSVIALSLAPVLVDQTICISQAGWKPHYFWTCVPALTRRSIYSSPGKLMCRQAPWWPQAP